MSIIFFDPADSRKTLLPLTYTRPISEIRIGVLTISEKWCAQLDTTHYGYDTEEYLSNVFPKIKADTQTLWINATVLPTNDLVEAIQALGSHEALMQKGLVLAFKGESQDAVINKKSFEGETHVIRYPWDIFLQNGREIASDYAFVTSNRNSYPLNDPHTITYGEDIFIEEGASIKAAILNAEGGPIYIGKNAEVQEGSIIRGPFALCEGGSLRMGCKIRGDSTVGPYSKVGGEVSNSVIFGNSNKAHEGYLGNSVIGEWCNLGAGTNNSNLKNNYEPVKMWDYQSHQFEPTGLQFCGLIMGDHTKTGIGSMFNTGTTVGVSANIFGSGFPRQIIPSFSWGGARGFITYEFQKAVDTIKKVMERRNIDMKEAEIEILKHVFDNTSEIRNWQKQRK
ncbi:MAG: GlmU family protein [Cyclobacteriaceae bacterium]